MVKRQTKTKKWSYFEDTDMVMDTDTNKDNRLFQYSLPKYCVHVYCFPVKNIGIACTYVKGITSPPPPHKKSFLELMSSLLLDSMNMHVATDSDRLVGCSSNLMSIRASLRLATD